MAFTFIQGPTANTSTATTNAKAFAGSVSVGNLVVVYIAQVYGANPPRSITGVTDNAAGGSNTYSLGKSRLNASGDSKVDVYYSVIARGGTLTVTTTFTGGLADSAMAIDEYSVSAGSTIALDATNSNTGTTSPATPGSVTPTGTCLYVSMVTHTEGGAMTPAAGWDQRQEIESNGTCTINVHDDILSGAQNPQTTMAATIGKWVAAIVTFNETAAAGGATLTPTIGSQVLTGIAPRNDRGIFVPTEVDP